MTREPSSEVAACEYGDSKRDCSLNELLVEMTDLRDSHQRLCKLAKQNYEKTSQLTKEIAEMRHMMREILKRLKPAGAMLLALMLASSGCTSSSLRTKTPLNVESKHRVGPMIQTCGHAEEMIPLVEQAYPVVLEEMARVGVITDRAKLAESLRSTRGCLVEEPDSCSELKPGCAGDPRCARRRECAMAWGKYFWVSRWWPPICRGEWPTEPNCVPVGSPARESDYKKHIVVGLANLFYQASGHTDNFHFAPKVLAAIAAANKRLGW